MASDYVLDAFKASIETFYAADQSISVARIENHENPQKVIGNSSANLGKTWILIRNQPTRRYRARLSQQAPADEEGTIDLDVIVPAHGLASAQAQKAHDIMKTMTGDGGFLWDAVDDRDLIEVEECVEGPAGDRLGGSFFGLMVSISYNMAGGGF